MPLTPVQIDKAREIARELTLRSPSLDVLKPEHRDDYSPLANALQANVSMTRVRRRLLLPNLRAYGNGTVAIFSDYGGEGSGGFLTYSFLVCAWNEVGWFQQEMRKVRWDSGLGHKEIEFKDFGMERLRRAIPVYLDLLDKSVPGLLFTLVIDKRLPTVFGPPNGITKKWLSTVLDAEGFGRRKAGEAEKLLRIVHTAAFLTGLLAHNGHKLFWMSDQDAICANERLHKNALQLFSRVLSIYCAGPFPLVGGATPFKERDVGTLDLLSAADVVAGAVADFMTKYDSARSLDFGVKAGADLVLQWLGHDGIALKKLSVIIKPGEDGALQTGVIEFTPTNLPSNVTFIGIQP